MLQKLLLVLILIAGLLAPACTSVLGKRDESGGMLRVGIVFDIGGKDDKSFNAAAWEGVKRAKQELGIFPSCRGIATVAARSQQRSAYVLCLKSR